MGCVQDIGDLQTFRLLLNTPVLIAKVSVLSTRDSTCIIENINPGNLNHAAIH